MPLPASTREVVFEVDGLPPGKNEAKSLLATGHPHAPRVVALLAAARAAVGSSFTQWAGLIGLEVTIYGEPDGDATNYLGGIGDVLQEARRNLPSDTGLFLYKDDEQIREIHYRQEASDRVRFRIRLWEL